MANAIKSTGSIKTGGVTVLTELERFVEVGTISKEQKDFLSAGSVGLVSKSILNDIWRMIWLLDSLIIIPWGLKAKIAQILENPNNAKSQKSVKAKPEESAQAAAEEATLTPSDDTVETMAVINIMEEVSINDIRFFAGSRVEVSKADADKLIKAGKAKMNAE